jgi:hypothetical protein
MSKYPVKFSQKYIDMALSKGFTNPRISTWQGRSNNSRFYVDYKTEHEFYSVTWQLKDEFGNPNSHLLIGYGDYPKVEVIRDENGNGCYDFATFDDFMSLAVADIKRRTGRINELIENRRLIESQCQVL